MGISGLRQRHAFVKEASYGTDPGTGYASIGSIQGDPSLKVGNKLIPVKAAGRINTRSIFEGQVEVGASIDWFVQDGAFLAMCLGDFDTTSPVTNGSNYQHLAVTEDSTSTTAVPVEYEVNSFSFNMGLEDTTDDVLKLTGCKCNNLTVTLGMDEPLRASADIFAKTIDYETTNESFNEIAYGPWMYHNKGTVNVDNSAVADLVSLSFSVAQNLQREYGILPDSNKRCVTAIHQGQREVSGTIRFNYDNYTNLQKFFSENAGAISPSDSKVKEFNVTFLLDNMETTTAAGYRGIYIEIIGMKLGDLTKTFPQNGSVVTEEYSFTAKNVKASWFDATATDNW